jgi:hypothetical protein
MISFFIYCQTNWIKITQKNIPTDLLHISRSAELLNYAAIKLSGLLMPGDTKFLPTRHAQRWTIQQAAFSGTAKRPSQLESPFQLWSTCDLRSPGPSCIVMQSRDLAAACHSSNTFLVHTNELAEQKHASYQSIEDSEVPTIKLHSSFSHVLLRFPSPIENGAVPTAMIGQEF